jgi:hypothetical protein
MSTEPDGADCDAGRDENSVDKSHSSSNIWSWSLVGFGLGILSSGAYLLLGGDYFWSVPRYARLLFYPGFAAGYRAYEWGLSESVSEVVGVLVVGIVYGLTAFLLAWACRIDAVLREANHQNLGPE